MNIVNFVILLIVAVALMLSCGDDKVFSLQRSKLLKAVLPYGVIVGHISAYNTNVFKIAIVGSFIVGVFFFISAYGLECKRQKGVIHVRGLLNRLCKLVSPLIVPIVVYIVALLVQGQDAQAVIMDNLRSYQFILPFTWFVIILAVFYTIFYVLSSVKRIDDRTFLLALTVCVIVFSGANFILFRDSAYTNFSSLCFPAGVLYRQYESAIVQFLKKKVSYIICLLILLATGLMTPVNYLLPLTILLWSTMIIVFITLVCVKEKATLNFFSNISYEVYACQGITFLFIPQHFDQFHPMLHIVMTIALTIAIATVCHYITKFSKRLLHSSRC